MIKTILFDLDGTLLNTIDDLADAANWVCTQHGWPTFSVETYKHFVGNAIPKVILSWDHTFRYKNWDLSVFLRSWLDYDVFSQVNMYYGLANDSQLNVLKSAYTRNRNIKDEKILCDYWIDDASFLKIDAINLGYTLDLKRWTRYIQSAKIYLTIRDVAVFTDYNGINPEVDINGLNPGFEYVNNTASMYPQTTRFTLGVQLTF